MPRAAIANIVIYIVISTSAVFGDVAVPACAAVPFTIGEAAACAAVSTTYTNVLKCVVPNVTKLSATTELHLCNFEIYTFTKGYCSVKSATINLVENTNYYNFQIV